jgi:hypothetical protein
MRRMGRLVHEEGEEGDTVEDGLFEAVMGWGSVP